MNVTHFFVRFIITGLMMSLSIGSADWTIETVDDSPLVGRYSSLAIDSVDWPHISYYDETNGNLKYAYRTGTGWHHEIVTSAGDVGSFTDLALTTDNRPFISYFDNINYTIRLAFKSSGNWYFLGVAQTGISYPVSSIALNSSNYYYVGYVIDEGADTKVRISYFDGSDTYFHHVQSNADEVGSCSLALNSANEPYVTYGYPVNASLENLKFAFYNSPSWYYEVVNSDQNSGMHSCVQIDSASYPHVAHANFDGYLVYSYRDASGWHTQTTSYPISSFIDMDLDSAAYPHIISTNAVDWTVRHMYLDASGWHTEIVYNQTISGGAYAAIAVDTDDDVHVSFYARDDNTLKYGRRFDPPTPTPTNTPIVPTPTPTGCAQTGVTIKMPFPSYSAGDTCFCRAYVCNAEKPRILTGYPLFVILDVYHNYFFAPSFNSVFDNYLDLYSSFPVGLTTVRFFHPSIGRPGPVRPAALSGMGH